MGTAVPDRVKLLYVIFGIRAEYQSAWMSKIMTAQPGLATVGVKGLIVAGLVVLSAAATDGPPDSGGTAVGSPTAVQAWQPCPLWELSPSHPHIIVD